MVQSVHNDRIEFIMCFSREYVVSVVGTTTQAQTHLFFVLVRQKPFIGKTILTADDVKGNALRGGFIKGGGKRRRYERER